MAKKLLPGSDAIIVNEDGTVTLKAPPRIASFANVVAATTSVAGSMSAADKTKLGGLITWLPFGIYTSLNPLSAAGSPFLATVDRTITFVKWTNSVLVITTNNGSNYWTIALRRWSDDSEIKTLDTSAFTAGAIGQISTTSFTISSIGTTGNGIYVTCAKVGSPGNLYLGGPALEVTG